MIRTSRLRRLHVVEPSPLQHEPKEPPREPPAGDSEASQPDSADPDIDAISTGMSLLLRLALRLMKSYNTSPSWRGRSR